MDVSSSLARIWADATPLAQFVEARAVQLSRVATPGRKTRTGHKPSSMEMLASALESNTSLIGARSRAKIATINDLIAGRIVAVGRPSDTHSFERIDPSFWIGAEVDWIRDATSRGGRRVIEVRMVNANDIPSIQPRLHEVPGRPSKSDVITGAIADYAKRDPRLERPPTERLRAYYAYISARDYNPRRDKGFSEKTIQKFERLFRSKNK